MNYFTFNNIKYGSLARYEAELSNSPACSKTEVAEGSFYYHGCSVYKNFNSR